MKTIKLWPHAALIALGVALAAGAGVWLYQRNSNNAEAAALPNAARIQRVDGEVAYLDANASEWRVAGPNESFSVGDRIYTRDNASTSLAFNGRNYARLDPNTELDAIVLTDDSTQLALRDGAAVFEVPYLDSGDLFEVGTPYGAVEFQEPGLYYVDVNDGNAMVSVLSGLAQVVGLAGSGQISKGEMLTLLGATAAEIALARLNRDDAGYFVDDYYRYQYPNVYDGRYVSYDTYLNDPFYFDPYRNDVSYRYVTFAIPGVNDLSYYGDWRDIDNYGYAWSPRVDAGWAPYQNGYWIRDYPYGMTWVSSEPWGYAPYHYGRWAFVGDRWYWVPDAVNTTPSYSPALVAFLPLNQNEIGWVPLGPDDPYVYRYYDENWQPHYLTRDDLIVANLANWAAPNAVTVVPVDYFGRPVDPRFVRRVDHTALAHVQPTLEPLLLTPLRNAAINSAWGRGKIDLPPGIGKKLDDRRVILGTAPLVPPFKKDLARTLRLDGVDNKVKNQKMKVRDERNADTAQADAARRQQQINELAREAERGNRDARRQVQELQQEQRKVEQQQRQDQRAQQRVDRSPRAEGVRIGNPNKPPRIERDRGRPMAAPRPEPARPAKPSKPPHAEGARVGNPARAEAPRPQAQREQPGRGAVKQEAKQSAAPKGGGGGGGKGKGKKP